MPQMSPMWWLTLYIMFNLNFFLIMCKMYFNLILKKHSTKELVKHQLNWKW